MQNTPSPSHWLRFVYVALGFTWICSAGLASAQSAGGWTWSRKIHLNTTPQGGEIANDVNNYPLAVMFDRANFTLTGEAAPDGKDIRFFDSEGKPLSYAIEDWDHINEFAMVWVKLPVVKGNSDKQWIVMKWGNKLASDASDSKTVFGKPEGFLAVYHLNEDGNTNAGGYKDSSWNEVHATGEKMELGSRANGRLGSATRFQNPNGGEGGNVRWIYAGGAKVTNDFNFTDAHPISASAWAWADSFDGYYQTIVSKGDRSWTLQRDWDKRIEVCTLVTNQPKNYHSCAIADKTNHPPVTKVWNHYLISMKPGKLSLFVNGRFVESVGGTTILGYHDFAIANNAQHAPKPKEKRGWDGIIDEVRVMSVEKNADWAKLDYESQREGQKVVTFGERKREGAP